MYKWVTIMFAFSDNSVYYGTVYHPNYAICSYLTLISAI